MSENRGFEVALRSEGRSVWLERAVFRGALSRRRSNDLRDASQSAAQLLTFVCNTPAFQSRQTPLPTKRSLVRSGKVLSYEWKRGNSSSSPIRPTNSRRQRTDFLSHDTPRPTVPTLSEQNQHKQETMSFQAAERRLGLFHSRSLSVGHGRRRRHRLHARTIDAHRAVRTTVRSSSECARHALAQVRGRGKSNGGEFYVETEGKI